MGMVHGVSGKVTRLIGQFTPYSWDDYRWGIFQDFRRFAYAATIIAGTMLVELDAFFLKDIFYVPSASPLNVYRLGIWFLVAVVGMRDFYAFMSDPTVKRLGASGWVVLAMCLMELFVVIKFGRVYYAGRELEAWKMWTWIAILSIGFVGVAYWFFFRHGCNVQKEKRAAASAAAAAAAIMAASTEAYASSEDDEVAVEEAVPATKAAPPIPKSPAPVVAAATPKSVAKSAAKAPAVKQTTPRSAGKAAAASPSPVAPRGRSPAASLRGRPSRGKSGGRK
jgi:hypothetical protein